MKAYLEIEMPKNCKDCAASHFDIQSNGVYYGYFCKVLRKDVPECGKPDNCPLKPIEQ